MNKLWAKVEFKNDENAEYMIKAFFKDFNPESSIVIRGMEAKLEICFQEAPMEIIKTISHCHIIEFNYVKNLKEYEEDETMKVETESKSSKHTKNHEKSRKVTKKEESNTKAVKRNSRKFNIPELENIAKEATSFEHFVKLVAEWLEMDKRQEFFENLAIATTEVDSISWKKLENTLKDKRVAYLQWDKVWTSRQISEKLKEYDITILPFLREIEKYKEYFFKRAEESSEKEESAEQLTEKQAENVEEKAEDFNKSVILKPRVKMECMPEIKEFEEILASVDKTLPVEDRVRYVLKAMSLNKLSAEEQKNLVEFASIAVKKEKTDLRIFVDEDISNRQKLEAHMIFARFINDFVQEYESGKKVKLLEFLSDLQKIIMLDSEIETSKNATE